MDNRYLNLRLWLGVLALTLPLILIVGNLFILEESISHFYYTRVNVFFTGALFAFGLMLLSYPGYEKEEELITDNTLTNLAGLFAIITALVPTAHDEFVSCASCLSDCKMIICQIPNGHGNSIYSTIHLVSAFFFLALIGFMCNYRFTLSGDKILTDIKIKRNKIYRFCGWGIWISLLVTGVLFAVDHYFTDLSKFKFVFFLEWLMLLFFGVAWLTKSKSLKKMGL